MVDLGKLRNIFHRKSIDERIEEAFASQERESFSKKVWEANLKAQQKLRSEIPAAAKALVKRPEERYNPYYPGIYEGPHGNPHEEGALTKQMEHEAQPRSEFGRFDEDFKAERSKIVETQEHEDLSKSPNVSTGPAHFSELSKAPVFPIEEKTPAALSRESSDMEGIGRNDLKEVMDELREIREQNAVILERLRALERKLERV